MSRDITQIDKFNRRLENLREERSKFFDYWGELSDYILAHRGRFLLKTNTRKPKRNTKQYNNTARRAARTLTSGMMAGITSPARQWFKLASPDPGLNEVASVRHWLHKVQNTMERVFEASNVYNSLHSLYAELGVFGTGALGVFENFDTVIRTKTYTVGSYMLGLGLDDTVDTFYREYTLRVGQVIKKFGEDNVSHMVKNQWDNGNTEADVQITHAIEPNDNRDRMSPLARDKVYRSVYYEAGSNKMDDKFLLRSGFDEFPIMAPRWDITGEETYSEDCPGMVALGDTKGLQLGEKRMYQALDKVGNPPLQGDNSMKSSMRSGSPGPGETIFHSANSSGLTSVYGNYRPDIGALKAVQNDVEQRINEAFYVDLFLMLASSDRRQITAREVAEKHEEKLLMLGPVLERLHTELLDKLIDRTFNILQRNGVLPPPPTELVNRQVSVKYVSVLAQAQRLVGIGAIERTIGFVMQMSKVFPEARHKVDAQQVVDQYALDAGVDPRIIRPDEHARELLQAERQQQAQDAAMQRSALAIDNAKNLAEARAAGGQSTDSARVAQATGGV